MRSYWIRPFVCSLAVGVTCVFGGFLVAPTMADGQSSLFSRQVQDSSRVQASVVSLTPVKDGGVARLVESHKGKVVLVNFWATWCSPCREELPHLIQLERDLEKEGFQLIIISADEPEQEQEASRFLDSIGAKKPRYIKQTEDNDAFINAIDSTWSGALPALFLYDRSGKRVGSFFGETEVAVIQKAVREAMK
jgi:thiol-disulfide isomerase/thioredoxin